MRWIITETNNGHKFQFTKLSVTDFFLNDRKNVFQVHSQNRLVAIFRGQKSISVLSREKFFYQSHRIRNFRFFLSSVWPSSPSRQFWTTVSVSDTNSVFQCFRSGHNSRKHWIENGEGFAIYSSTWQSGAKGAKGVTCQQLIGDVKHAWKIIVFSLLYSYGFSQGWKSLKNTAILYDKWLSHESTCPLQFLCKLT